MKREETRRPGRLVLVGIGAAASVALAGGGLAATATTAGAAGSGYGGAPPLLPAPGIPGGFRNVLSAFSVGKAGHRISEPLDHAQVHLLVPPGATRSGEQVVLTRPSLGVIRPGDYKGIPVTKRHDDPVYGLGVLLERGGANVRDHRFATLVLTGKEFTRHDYVVVYSAARHGFVPAPKGHARCGNGQVVVRFRSGTELLVLA